MECTEWNIIPKANSKISGPHSWHVGKNKLALQLFILFRKYAHSNVIFLNIREGHAGMFWYTESKIVQLFNVAFFKRLLGLKHTSSSFSNLKVTTWWWLSVNSQYEFSMWKEKEKNGFVLVKIKRWGAWRGEWMKAIQFWPLKYLQGETCIILKNSTNWIDSNGVFFFFWKKGRGLEFRCLCYNVNLKIYKIYNLI